MTFDIHDGKNITDSIRARREILEGQLEALDIEIDKTQSKLDEQVTGKMRLSGAIEEYTIIFKQLQQKS